MDIAVGPVTVSLIDACDRIVWHVVRGHAFEPDSLALWAEWCAAAGEIIDIGAYSGLFSIAAAKLGCYVTAFEPVDVIAQRLAENAAINKAKVEIIAAAASDKTGEAPLYYNATVLTAGSSLEPRWPSTSMVATRRIDDLRFGAVAAIKIDVEGHEVSVLKGAAALIARDRPRLLVETLTKSARSAVAALLPGYRETAFLDGRNMILEPRCFAEWQSR